MAKCEILTRVDRNDKVIGTVDREAAHKNKELIHREIGVVIVREDGKVLFQKRSMDKKVLPGWWSTGCAGHVKMGYETRETAVEELQEELKIVVNEGGLEFWGKEYTEQVDERREEAHYKYWYVMRVGMDFKVQADGDEVEKAEFFDIDDINKLRNTGENFYEPYLNVVGTVLSGDNSEFIQEEYAA